MLRVLLYAQRTIDWGIRSALWREPLAAGVSATWRVGGKATFNQKLILLKQHMPEGCEVLKHAASANCHTTQRIFGYKHGQARRVADH